MHFLFLVYDIHDTETYSTNNLYIPEPRYAGRYRS